MALDGPDYDTIWHVLMVNTDHYFSNFKLKIIQQWGGKYNLLFPYFLKKRVEHFEAFVIILPKANILHQHFLQQAFPAIPQGRYCLLSVDGVPWGKGAGRVREAPKANIMAPLQEWYRKIAGYLDNEEPGFASCGPEMPPCFPNIFMSTTHRTHRRAWLSTHLIPICEKYLTLLVVMPGNSSLDFDLYIVTLFFLLYSVLFH